MVFQPIRNRQEAYRQQYQQQDTTRYPGLPQDLDNISCDAAMAAFPLSINNLTTLLATGYSLLGLAIGHQSKAFLTLQTVLSYTSILLEGVAIYCRIKQLESTRQSRMVTSRYSDNERNKIHVARSSYNVYFGMLWLDYIPPAIGVLLGLAMVSLSVCNDDQVSRDVRTAFGILGAPSAALWNSYANIAIDKEIRRIEEIPESNMIRV